MKLFVTPTSSSTTTTLALMVMVMMMISAPFSHVQAQEAEQEAQQPELFSTDHIVTLPLMADMEVPPIENSTALGGIALVYNEASDAILWAMDIFNPEMWELTAAHIHCGNVGENGPVLVPLLTDLADSSTEMGFAGAISQNNILPPQEGDDCSSSYENVLDIWVALAAGLGLYVNVHSTETPSGELRGDAAAAIQPIPDSIIALDLSGEYEVPPNDNSTAFGTSTFVYSSATDSIGWVMDISNPDQLQIFGDIGAHIHCGGAGTNGGVIVTLVPPGITDDSPMIGQAGLITSNNFVPGLCFDNIPELWLAMKTGSIVYVNVHSEENPGGEIRGNFANAITAPPAPGATAMPSSTMTATTMPSAPAPPPAVMPTEAPAASPPTNPSLTAAPTTAGGGGGSGGSTIRTTGTGTSSMIILLVVALATTLLY